jgi:hypothetical protein
VIAELFLGLECVLKEELGSWGIDDSFSSDWALVLAIIGGAGHIRGSVFATRYVQYRLHK